MKYISDNNFLKLLEILGQTYEVFVPVKKDRQRFYKKYPVDENNSDIVVGEVRAFEPLKAFFSRSREKVAQGFKNETLSVNKPYCIVGVKACDLKGFKVQDHVFLNHDYQDPFYIRMRKENLIISADCTFAIDTCFCGALGIKPYPQQDFDINLSVLREGGFVVEVGSEKGKELIKKHSSFFEDARNKFVYEKDKQREEVVKEVEENIRENNIPKQDLYKDIIAKNYEADIWADEAKTCVECAGCNTICPTCHCFLLYDQKDDGKMARMRIWDSCMIKDFARVAGGVNPRPKLWMRLRNRFEKKFDFFPKVAEVYACTGCGRCISVCPAKIDIRKVLKRLVDNAAK